MFALLLSLGCAPPEASGVELIEIQRPGDEDSGGPGPVDGRPGPEDSAPPPTGTEREGGLCDGAAVVARVGLGQSGYLPMPVSNGALRGGRPGVIRSHRRRCHKRV